jgi:hypothetical protein
LKKTAWLSKRRILENVLLELKSVFSSALIYIFLYILFHLWPNFSEMNVWDKKRSQAQPFINRIQKECERKLRYYEQIGFLSKCQKKGLIPKGLRLKLPPNVAFEKLGLKIKLREELKIIKHTIQKLFWLKQNTEENIAKLKLQLVQQIDLPRDWVEWEATRVFKKAIYKIPAIRERLIKKFNYLREERRWNEERIKLAEARVNAKYKSGRRTVYNNSSKCLNDAQMKLLSLGLNFSITPNRFPLVEYITAAETLCRRMEETKEEDSVEKAKMIRHLVLDELKKSYHMKFTRICLEKKSKF